MLLLAIADRPSPESFAVVPFIARDDDGRNLIAGWAYQSEIDDGELAALITNTIGAHDVAPLGIRLDAFTRGSAAGWIGETFAARCRELGAPEPEPPAACHALPGLARFWIGAAQDVLAVRRRWTEAAARKAIRERDRALADLMRWAEPHALETEAAVWHACSSPEEREAHVRRCAQVIVGDRDSRKPERLREAYLRAVVRLVKE